MANTIDLSFHFVAAPSTTGAVTQVGYRGRFTTTGNDIIQRTSSITTSIGALDVGSLGGAPGLVAIRCASDSSDSLKLYTANDGLAAKQYGILLPGQFAVWAPSASGTIWLKAAATTARYEYLAVEGPITGSLSRISPAVGGSNVSASVSISAVMNSLSNSFAAEFSAAEATTRRRHQELELSANTDLEITTQAAGYLFVHRESGAADSAKLRCTAASEFAQLYPLGFAFFPCPTMDAFYLVADTVGDSEIDFLNIARYTP